MGRGMFGDECDTSDDLGYEITRDLLASIRPQQTQRGDIIVVQGDIIEETYFIMAGCVGGVVDSLEGHPYVKFCNQSKPNWRKKVGKFLLEERRR